MKPTAIEIAGRLIGPGHPAYIVAEIGINHNGDMALARQMIDAAKDAGADAVKFQNYATEDFITSPDLPITYVSQGKEVTESQLTLFSRCQLGKDDLRLLAEHCAKAGVDFHSTPTSEAGVADLMKLGVGVLKNGSDFLSHLPLIQAMARTGLPTVLSTGMAEEADIAESVDAFREAGGEKLILLHCVSQYPTPEDQLNLRKIAALRARFGCLTGFSDHSNGLLAATLACGLEVCWIEKHFTLSRDLPGPDHIFSSTPQEMADLVQSVRRAETMLGVDRLGLTSDEDRRSRDAYRLSCAAARDLREGEVVTAEDIAFLRPGHGIPPGRRDQIVGRKLQQNLAKGTLFTFECVA